MQRFFFISCLLTFAFCGNANLHSIIVLVMEYVKNIHVNATLDTLENPATPRIVKDGLPILPTLSVGSFNLTYSNYTSVVNSRKIIIVGFSSLSCTKCIAAENEYYKLFHYFLNLEKIDLARINVDDNKFITQQYPTFQVPHE